MLGVSYYLLQEIRHTLIHAKQMVLDGSEAATEVCFAIFRICCVLQEDFVCMFLLWFVSVCNVQLTRQPLSQ